MDQYTKAVALWQSRQIKTDAELAEALNGHSVSFAYHSGNLENERITYHDTREIFDHDGVTSKTWARQIERAEAKRTAGSDKP